MTDSRAFRVLGSGGDDRKEWLHAWAATGHEPFSHPAYVDLFAVDGARSHCAVITEGRNVVILPFLIRPVRAEGWTPRPEFDATSPYGYGGPYGTRGSDASLLWLDFARWLSERGVISYFGRLPPREDPPVELPGASRIVSDSENVVVDLTRSAEEQWLAYDHKVRKNVNKAKRSNLAVEISNTFSDVAEFTRLYHSTMTRRQASAWYYFDAPFFETLARDMAGSYLAAEVRDEKGTLVSAELVLTSDYYYYSYLGGTLSEAFGLRPNDLLKHAVIAHGHAAGRLGYVLGGGIGADDGLFRYKRSFDRSGCVGFRRLNMICDEEAYDALVVDRLDAARCSRLEPALQPGFFPLYRAPLVQASDSPGAEHPAP